MKNTAFALLSLLVVSACSYERTSSSSLPTSPSGAGSFAASPLVGRWTSTDGATGLMTSTADATTADLGRLVCTNIIWNAVDQQNDGTVQGPFTASCTNGIQLAGTAVGNLSGDSATITATGSGQYQGSPCAFTISSNGVVEGSMIRFPYTATTCVGEYSGTSFLARSALSPNPTPTVAACGRGDGDSVVECVAARYPDRLRAGVSHGERVANMEFLRDRIIEQSRCRSLDTAWNLKRGVGPHSIDAIAWRVNGRDEVVDIGVGYDDTSRALELQWLIVAGPPGYDRYTPSFSCQ
ncbi:MAG: hypothetical protein AB7L71_18010 [Vicinamibacterales bacterium]